MCILLDLIDKCSFGDQQICDIPLGVWVCDAILCIAVYMNIKHGNAFGLILTASI